MPRGHLAYRPRLPQILLGSMPAMGGGRQEPSLWGRHRVSELWVHVTAPLPCLSGMVLGHRGWQRDQSSCSLDICSEAEPQWNTQERPRCPDWTMMQRESRVRWSGGHTGSWPEGYLDGGDWASLLSCLKLLGGIRFNQNQKNACK